MTAIISLIIFFWAPAIIVIAKRILHDTYIWQIKEYRVDRIISTLRYKEEPSNRNTIINIIQLGLLVCAVLFLFYPINILLIIPAICFLSYVVEALNSLQDFVASKLTRPQISIRNILITGISLCILLLPMLIPISFVHSIYKDEIIEQTSIEMGEQNVTWEDFLLEEDVDTENVGIPLAILILEIATILIIASDMAAPLIVSISAVITEPLAQIKRKIIISKSVSKAKTRNSLKIVAITGSFGKTTTKEILYELIKDNFKTAKTDENYNSTVGIAMSVLNNLRPDTQVFIAEMGAYRKGEIKNSCKILKPDISVVTGLTHQHISLFGNIKNLFYAKYEIIEALKPKGIAILNGNNQYCVQMAAKTDRRKLLYYSIDKDAGVVNTIQTKSKNQDKNKLDDSIIYALNIEEIPDGYRFDLKFEDKIFKLQVKINGRHNISNILASIGVAMELGMDLKSIVAKLNSVNLPQICLKWFDGINASKTLDDGYNSNPNGFLSAIDELKSKQNKGRNIVITKGIIELGNKKGEHYAEIAKKMVNAVNILITSDVTLIEQVNTFSPKTETILVQDKVDFIKTIHNTVAENDHVLIEGAMNPDVINTLIEENDE